MLWVYVVFCCIVFGCQYQCNQLPGKTRLQNDLLCVEWVIKPYTLTHSYAVCDVVLCCHLDCEVGEQLAMIGHLCYAIDLSSAFSMTPTYHKCSSYYWSHLCYMKCLKILIAYVVFILVQQTALTLIV